MHTKRKKTLMAQVRTLKVKKKQENIFFVFFFISFVFILWLVNVCLISSSTFFSHITIVNYQVTMLLDRLLSNGLAILSTNYYYIHTVFVQVTITQIRLYICTGKSFFYCLSNQWVTTFHKLVQLFFALSVYTVVYCNNAHSKLKR